jgi:hypothetical protein
LAVALAARLLYRSPYDASDLRLTPDEVEYAVCARRLATLGRFDLPIDGTSVPPYSTPWFSALLAPMYLVAPNEIGNAIWIVFLFSIVGVVATLRIGTIVSGPLGGALAVIALLALHPYADLARVIMTDVPAVAIALLALWLFLRADPRCLRTSWIGGASIASAFALRSTYLALLLPFAWRAVRTRDKRVAHVVALLAPIALVATANALYNQATFGDWRRTGYQFWCAVPYDYSDLLVSAAYVAPNLAELAHRSFLASFAFGVAGAIALALRRPPRGSALLGFAASVALPISAFHLSYFYVDWRFHLLLIVMCLLIGGVGIASLVPERWSAGTRAPIAAAIVLAIACVALQPSAIRPPLRRIAADLIHRSTPDDAVIVSGIEPVYLEELAPPESRRIYLAASRDVEFADKVLVPSRIDRSLVHPRSPVDHMTPGLLEHGARRCIARTADEMHDEIDAWVRAGRPVYFETSFLSNQGALLRMLGSTLRPEQPGAPLTRLVAVN